MKIGINLIQYTDVQGIEVFAKNLLLSLTRQGASHEFIFFVNQESAKIFNIKADNVKIVVKNFKKLSKLNLISYQQFGLIRDLKKEKINLLYCPSTAAPIFYKNKIITIHDCASLRFKDEAGLISGLYLKLIYFSAKYFSLKVITVSNFAKQEIISLLKIPPEKIVVIFEGAPFLIGVDEKKSALALRKFELINKKYFFYVGNLRPRKNIPKLLEAWAYFISLHKDYFLVIAGKNNKQIDEAPYLKDNVLFTGVISEEEKTVLYKNSLSLVFPSLYEGFGLPVLEAQSLGIPVITSDISSLPEVAGDGAIFVDPCDYKSISLGLEKIVNSSFLKTELISAGYQNLARFSWDKSALLLLAFINNSEKYDF